MRYEKIISTVNSQTMSRADLAALKENAQARFDAGDPDARAVLEAINIASPPDRSILFMGFCPGADFADRLDLEWKAQSVCRYAYLEDEIQLRRFRTVCRGDLVVLKKNEQLGVTMSLYGHGRVQGAAEDDQGIRYLHVDWSSQDVPILVPAMACTSTVNIKEMTLVEATMPPAFFEWLEA